MAVIAFFEIPAFTSQPSLDASPESFEAFYAEALPRVYGYFLHRCGGSVAVAEDLTQETFMAAVAELKKQRDVAKPLAWIFGIARHKLLDHYRPEEREERRLALDWETAAVEDSQLTWSEDARERAVSALAAAPPRQRAALVLRYLDGLSVPEVAAALGRSVEATESLLARGRDAFKRRYVEESRG